MSHVDMLSSEEQDVLLWVAEAETGVAEPLVVSIADLPSAQVTAAVDQLVRHGFLSRESVWLNYDHTNLSDLCAHLTDQGAQVVVELWRRRLRETAEAVSLH